MPTITSYLSTGVKEEISNVITNIDPTATPFQTALKEESLDNKFFQWLEDTLNAAAANAQIEGFTPTSMTATQPSTRSNYTQILQKTVAVTGTNQSIKYYGRAKELAYALAKAGEEVKKDLELAMIGSSGYATAGGVAGSVSVARQFAAYQAMIDPTVTFYQDTGTTTIGASTPTALSEDVLLALNLALYNNGSEATTIMLKPGDALKMANFAYKQSAANVVQRSRELTSSENTITNVVDFYKSPYGTQRVVLNRNIKTTDALVYDPKYWSKPVLRPWFRETLAKTGDMVTVMMVGELSLKHKNFKASGMIRSLI